LSIFRGEAHLNLYKFEDYMSSIASIFGAKESNKVCPPSIETCRKVAKKTLNVVSRAEEVFVLTATACFANSQLNPRAVDAHHHQRDKSWSIGENVLSPLPWIAAVGSASSQAHYKLNQGAKYLSEKFLKRDVTQNKYIKESIHITFDLAVMTALSVPTSCTMLQLGSAYTLIRGYSAAKTALKHFADPKAAKKAQE
jgi:hypothetical protein